MQKVRLPIGLTMLVALSATTGHAEDKSSETMGKRLQGRWEIVAGFNQGRELTKQQLAGTFTTVTTNTMVTFDRDQRETYRALFRINEDEKPAQITLTSVPEQVDVKETTNAADAGVEPTIPEAIAKGILRFEGDRQWVLCYALPGGERPTEFDSPKGSKLMLFKLKKLESADDDPPQPSE